ncbi:MAG: hypothetical protein CMC73_06895, partial [Flavobacteriaceae bacterium]|nr:hypothetical protein [Flavobacteriaceae bacterium]
MLQGVHNAITTVMNGNILNPNHVNLYLDKYSSGVSYNTIRRHLNVLINEAVRQGMEQNPLLNIKSKKAKAILNKPFKEIAKTLDDIKAY